MPAPLIVTAWILDRDLEPFHRLREHFYPRSRNYLSAHVTLFHKLPGDSRGEVFAAVEVAARGFGESRTLAWATQDLSMSDPPPVPLSRLPERA